jgi:hypothetical protein
MLAPSALTEERLQNSAGVSMFDIQRSCNGLIKRTPSGAYVLTRDALRSLDVASWPHYSLSCSCLNNECREDEREKAILNASKAREESQCSGGSCFLTFAATSPDADLEVFFVSLNLKP